MSFQVELRGFKKVTITVIWGAIFSTEIERIISGKAHSFYP